MDCMTVFKKMKVLGKEQVVKIDVYQNRASEYLGTLVRTLDSLSPENQVQFLQQLEEKTASLVQLRVQVNLCGFCSGYDTKNGLIMPVKANLVSFARKNNMIKAALKDLEIHLQELQKGLKQA